jgi:hypothetical protein
MSKIIGIIAAVVLVIAAFVAFKNQKAYENETGNLRTAQAEKVRTVAELEAQRKRFKEAESSRDAKALKLVETGKILASAIRDYDDLKKEIVTSKEVFAEKERDVATANDIMKDLRSSDVLIPKLKRLRSQLMEAQEGTALEESKIARLNQQNQDYEQKIKSLNQIVGDYSSGRSLTSLKTTVRSIYSSWGFVILAGGDNEGVVPGSYLEVVRAEEVIAKLKVTAVEAGRAAADIVENSVAPGVALRAGDVVVPEQVVAQPAEVIGL